MLLSFFPVQVVAPRDVVVARPRDPDDRVAWLLEKSRFAEALQAAEKDRKVRIYSSILEKSISLHRGVFFAFCSP